MQYLQRKAEFLDKLNYAIENYPDEKAAENLSKSAESMIAWTDQEVYKASLRSAPAVLVEVDDKGQTPNIVSDTQDDDFVL